MSQKKDYKQLKRERNAQSQAIRRLAEMYAEQVHSVSIGYANKKDGRKYCVIFGLKKKKPLNEIEKKDLLPTSIKIPFLGRVETDVIETNVTTLNQSTIDSFDFWYNHESSETTDVENPDGTVSQKKQWTKIFAPNEEEIDNTLQNVQLNPIKSGCVITSESTRPEVGTLGYIVVDSEDKTLCALTNAHVVVNNQFIVSAKKGDFNESVIGTKIYHGNASDIENWGDDQEIGLVKKYWPIGLAGSTPAGSSYNETTMPVDAALIALRPDKVSSASWQLAGDSNHLGNTPPPIIDARDFVYFALDSLYAGYSKDVGGGEYDEPQMSFCGRSSGLQKGEDPKFRLLGPVSSVKIQLQNGSSYDDVWVHGAFGLALQPWEWRELDRQPGGSVVPKGSVFYQDTVRPGDSGSILFAKTKSIIGYQERVIVTETSSEEDKQKAELISAYQDEFFEKNGERLSAKDAWAMHRKNYINYNTYLNDGVLDEYRDQFPSYYVNIQITTLSYSQEPLFAEEPTWKAAGIVFARQEASGYGLQAFFYPMDEVARYLNIESWDGNTETVNYSYSSDSQVVKTSVYEKGRGASSSHKDFGADKTYHVSGTQRHDENLDHIEPYDTGFGVSKKNFPYPQFVGFEEWVTFDNFSVEVDNVNSIDNSSPFEHPVWLNLENLSIDLTKLPEEYSDVKNGALHLDAFIIKNDSIDDFINNYSTKKIWTSDVDQDPDTGIYGKFEIFNNRGKPSITDLQNGRDFYSEVFDGKSEFYGKSIRLINNGVAIDWTESEDNGEGGLKNQKIINKNAYFKFLPWIVSQDQNSRASYYAEPNDLREWVVGDIRLVFVLWKDDSSDRIRADFTSTNIDRDFINYLISTADYGQITDDKLKEYEVDLYVDPEGEELSKSQKRMVIEVDPALAWGMSVKRAVVANGGKYCLWGESTPLSSSQVATTYTDNVQTSRNDSIFTARKNGKIEIDWSAAPTHPLSFSLLPDGRDGGGAIQEIQGVSVNEETKISAIDFRSVGIEEGTPIYAFCKEHTGMGFEIGWNAENFVSELLGEFKNNEYYNLGFSGDEVDILLPISKVGVDGAVIEWGDGTSVKIPPHTKFSTAEFQNFISNQLGDKDKANSFYGNREFSNVASINAGTDILEPTGAHQATWSAASYDYEFTVPAGTKESAVITRLRGYRGMNFELKKVTDTGKKEDFYGYEVSYGENDRIYNQGELETLLGNSTGTIVDSMGAVEEASINRPTDPAALAKFHGINFARKITFSKELEEDTKFFVRVVKSYSQAVPIHRYDSSQKYQIVIRGDVEEFGIPSEHYSLNEDGSLSSTTNKIASAGVGRIFSNNKLGVDSLERFYEGAFSSTVTSILRFPQWLNAKYIRTFKGASIDKIDNTFRWKNASKLLNVFEDNKVPFSSIVPTLWDLEKVDQSQEIFKNSSIKSNLVFSGVYLTESLINSAIELIEYSRNIDGIDLSNLALEIGVPLLPSYGDDKTCEYTWLSRLLDDADDVITKHTEWNNKVFFNGACLPRVSVIENLKSKSVEAGFPAPGNGTPIKNVTGFFKGQSAITTEHLNILTNALSKNIDPILILDEFCEGVDVDLDMNLSNLEVNSFSLKNAFKGANITAKVSLPKSSYGPISLESSFEGATINHESIVDFLENLILSVPEGYTLNIDNVLKGVTTKFDIDLSGWNDSLGKTDYLFRFVDGGIFDKSTYYSGEKPISFSYVEGGDNKSIKYPEVFDDIYNIKEWYWLKATAPTEPPAMGWSRPVVYFYKEPIKNLYWGMPVKEAGYYPGTSGYVEGLTTKWPMWTANVNHTDIVLQVTKNEIKPSDHGLTGDTLQAKSIVSNFTNGIKTLDSGDNAVLASFNGDQEDWNDLNTIYIAAEAGYTIWNITSNYSNQNNTGAIQRGVDEPLKLVFDWSQLAESGEYAEWNIAPSEGAANNAQAGYSAFLDKTKEKFTHDTENKKITLDIEMSETWTDSSTSTRYVEVMQATSYNALDNGDVQLNVGDIAIILSTSYVNGTETNYIAKLVSWEESVGSVPYIPISVAGAFQPHANYPSFVAADITAQKFKYVKRNVLPADSLRGYGEDTLAEHISQDFYSYGKDAEGNIVPGSVQKIHIYFGHRGKFEGKVDAADIDLNEHGWYAFYADSYNLMSSGEGEWLRYAYTDTAKFGSHQLEYISNFSGSLIKNFSSGLNISPNGEPGSNYLFTKERPTHHALYGVGLAENRSVNNQWILVNNNASLPDVILTNDSHTLTPNEFQIEIGGSGFQTVQKGGLFRKIEVDSDADGIPDNLDSSPNDGEYPANCEVTIVYRDSSQYSNINATLKTSPDVPESAYAVKDDLNFDPSVNQVTLLLTLTGTGDSDFPSGSSIDWGDGTTTVLSVSNADESFTYSYGGFTPKDYAFRHNYSGSGDKTVKIFGRLKKLFPEGPLGTESSSYQTDRNFFPFILKYGTTSFAQKTFDWFSSNYRIKTSKIKGGAFLESVGVLHATYLPRDLFHQSSREMEEYDWANQAGSVHPFFKDYTQDIWGRELTTNVTDNSGDLRLRFPGYLEEDTSPDLALGDWVLLSSSTGNSSNYMSNWINKDRTDSTWEVASGYFGLFAYTFDTRNEVARQAEYKVPMAQNSGNSANVISSYMLASSTDGLVAKNTSIYGTNVGIADAKYPNIDKVEKNLNTLSYMKGMGYREWLTMVEESNLTSRSYHYTYPSFHEFHGGYTTPWTSIQYTDDNMGSMFYGTDERYYLAGRMNSRLATEYASTQFNSNDRQIIFQSNIGYDDEDANHPKQGLWYFQHSNGGISSNSRIVNWKDNTETGSPEYENLETILEYFQNYRNAEDDGYITTSEELDAIADTLIGETLATKNEQEDIIRYYMISRAPSADDEQLSFSKKDGYDWVKFLWDINTTLSHNVDLMTNAWVSTSSSKKYNGAKPENFFNLDDIVYGDGLQKTDWFNEGSKYRKDLDDAMAYWARTVEFPKSVMESHVDGTSLQFKLQVSVLKASEFSSENTMASASWTTNDGANPYGQPLGAGEGNKFGNIVPTAGWVKINEKFFFPVDDEEEAEFDMIDSVTGRSHLFATIRHEIGHSLGLGSTLLGSSAVSDRPVIERDGGFYYQGTRGFDAYRAHLNWNLRKSVIGMPLEDSGGGGTAGGHFEEGHGGGSTNNRQVDGIFHPGLENENMTGIGEGGYEPISVITLGVLDDLGWYVNMENAEVLNLRLPYPTLHKDIVPSGRRNILGASRPAIHWHEATEVDAYTDLIHTFPGYYFAGGYNYASFPGLGNSGSSQTSRTMESLSYKATSGPFEIVWNNHYVKAAKSYHGTQEGFSLGSNSSPGEYYTWNTKINVEEIQTLFKLNGGTPVDWTDIFTLYHPDDKGQGGSGRSSQWFQEYSGDASKHHDGNGGVLIKWSHEGCALEAGLEESMQMLASSSADDKFFGGSWSFARWKMCAMIEADDEGFWAIILSGPNFNLLDKTIINATNTKAEGIKYFRWEDRQWEWEVLHMGIYSTYPAYVYDEFSGRQVWNNSQTVRTLDASARGTDWVKVKKKSGIGSLSAGPKYAALRKLTVDYDLQEIDEFSGDYFYLTSFNKHVDESNYVLNSSLGFYEDPVSMVVSDISTTKLGFDNFIENIDLTEMHNANISNNVVQELFLDVQANHLDFSNIDITNSSNIIPSIRGCELEKLTYFKIDDDLLDPALYNDGSITETVSYPYGIRNLAGFAFGFSSPELIKSTSFDGLHGRWTMYAGKHFNVDLYNVPYHYYYYLNTTNEKNKIVTRPALEDKKLLDRVHGTSGRKGELTSDVQCDFADLQVGDFVIYYALESELTTTLDGYTVKEWYDMFMGDQIGEHYVYPIFNQNDIDDPVTEISDNVVLKRINSSWHWGLDNSEYPVHWGDVKRATWLYDEYLDAETDSERLTIGRAINAANKATLDSNYTLNTSKLNYGYVKSGTLQFEAGWQDGPGVDEFGSPEQPGRFPRVANVATNNEFTGTAGTDYEIIGKATETSWRPVLAEITSKSSGSVEVKILSDKILKDGERTFTLNQDSYEDYQNNGLYKNLLPVAGSSWQRTIINNVVYENARFDILSDEEKVKLDSDPELVREYVIRISNGGFIPGDNLEYDSTSKLVGLRNFSQFSQQEMEKMQNWWSSRYAQEATGYIGKSDGTGTVSTALHEGWLGEGVFTHGLLLKSVTDILEYTEETATRSSDGGEYSYYNFQKLNDITFNERLGINPNSLDILYKDMMANHARRVPVLFDLPMDSVGEIDFKNTKAKFIVSSLFGGQFNNKYGGIYEDRGYSEVHGTFGRNNKRTIIKRGGTFDLSLIDYFPKWNGIAYQPLLLGNYNVTIQVGDIDNPIFNKFWTPYWESANLTTNNLEYGRYGDNIATSDSYTEQENNLISAKNGHVYPNNRMSDLSTPKKSLLQNFPWNIAGDGEYFFRTRYYNTSSFVMEGWPVANDSKMTPEGSDKVFWQNSKTEDPSYGAQSIGTSKYYDQGNVSPGAYALIW